MLEGITEKLDPIETTLNSDLMDELKKKDKNLVMNFILPTVEELHEAHDLETLEKNILDEMEFANRDNSKNNKQPFTYRIKVDIEDDCISCNFRSVDVVEESGKRKFIPSYTRLVYSAHDLIEYGIPELRFDINYDPGIKGLDNVKLSLVYINCLADELEGRYEKTGLLVQALCEGDFSKWMQFQEKANQEEETTDDEVIKEIFINDFD